MKIKLLSLFTATVMLLTGTFFASAVYAPEVGEGYISFDFSEITCGICNNTKTATVEKNVTFDGRNTSRIIPTPEIAETSLINLDTWILDKYEAKIEVPRYKYVGVTYYYDTDVPTYTEKMTFNILTGSTKALTVAASEMSLNDMVANEWAEAVFSFSGKYSINEESEKPYINQTHFLPFGNTDVVNLSSDDVLYIEKYTFYEKNPDPNASYTAEFVRGNPDAVGDNPENIIFKEGNSFVLPENPFTIENGEFLGWVCSFDGELYQPGYEISNAQDLNMLFTAKWKITRHYDDPLISLDYTLYSNGVVNNVDSTVFYGAVTEDGQSAVKVIPNPDSTMATMLALDGFSYGGSGVDFDAYKWVTVAYKYVSPNPVTAKMRINVMSNGGILSRGYGKNSVENITSGEWSFAKFDMTDIDGYLNPDNSHELRQLHLYPFGNAMRLENLSTDDEMYISRIMFFKEEPTLYTHNAYITGYDDGNFKPYKTLTRAEACAIAARVLTENEESIIGESAFSDVSDDKWYAKYIGFCEEYGLLDSYSGSFFPEKAMTRSEFAELVFDMGLADVGNGESIPPEAQPVDGGNISVGISQNGEVANIPITRAQAVTMINRARGRDMSYDRIDRTFNMIFLDVKNDNWAYANIAEAVLPHVEVDEAWVYALKDPADIIGDNFHMDFTDGEQKLAEVESLSEARKAAILSTPSDLSSITGRTFYVASDGDDSNDGLSPESPWKTVEKLNGAPLSKGDGVLFKRGDLWRERLKAKAGVTYSAYGIGDKPIIYGSPEDGADASKWTLYCDDASTGAKIWKYSNEGMHDIGNVVFNNGSLYGYKEIPTYKDGKFVVRGHTGTDFVIENELDRNLEFVHLAQSAISGGIPDINNSVGPLYLRCDDGNPGEVFNNIEFSTRTNVIGIIGNNITIDNLCIMYGGSHGIGSGTVNGLTVKNCVLGWIGGSIQYYNATSGSVVRFGNGVEIYGGCDGYTIENCYVYQNYDAGITHQHGNGTTDISMYNITYRGNLIEDCVYNIEYFHGASENNAAKRDGKNVFIEDNILRRAGYGFGSTRPGTGCQCHIKGWDSRNEFVNYVIRNNIFDRSTWTLIHLSAEYKAWLPAYSGNTFIQGYGNFLVKTGVNGSKAYINDYSATDTIRNVLGDATGKLYIVDYIEDYTFPYGD